MEFLTRYFTSILPLVLLVTIPLITLMIYGFIRNKVYRTKGKIHINDETEDARKKESSGKNGTYNDTSLRASERKSPKFYKWFMCSAIGSFVLFSGFIYAKGGGVAQLGTLLTYWGIGFINVAFWSGIVSIIAKFLKRNWRKDLIDTATIMIFIQVCITVAQVPG